ncbi:MAG: hypothetical protein IJD39_07595 [Clostridia bacterium]|nr:hypothetical protein [Clostridia bacterium]
MARDMAKKNVSDYRWTRDNCTRITAKIRNDSGIPEAVDRVKQSGKSANSYIIQALREKLIRDGYLSPESEPTNNDSPRKEEMNYLDHYDERC